MTKDEFKEIPYAVQMHWPETKQLEYQMMRDLHTAENPMFSAGFTKDFYLNRAASYKRKLNELLRGGIVLESD